MDATRDASNEYAHDAINTPALSGDEDAGQEVESEELRIVNETSVTITDASIKGAKNRDANISASDNNLASVNLASVNPAFSDKIQVLQKEIMDLKLELWKEITAKSDLINRCYTLEKLWKNSISFDSGVMIHRLKTLDIIKSDNVYEAMASIDLSLFMDASFE